MTKNTSYRDAGVDIDEGTKLVELIKPMVATTRRPEVATDLGGFGAAFRLDTSKYKKPLLVSATDGVGTKLKVAFWANMHQTVGIDLVAMSVNDLVVQGAEPLFFLDYFACGKLKASEAANIVSGIVEGCNQSGCSLIGGETAEMPGFYPGGEYELAGFAVGVVDEENMIDGKDVCSGDVILGMTSNGLHSNGYSLVRKIVFEKFDLDPNNRLPGTDMIASHELLRPTKIYVKPILEMAKNNHIKALAHITGGGFFDNIPRVLPSGCSAKIDKSSIPKQEIFSFLQEHGPVQEHEMYRTFNMGIGMVVIAAKEHVDELKEAARKHGEDLIVIGEVFESSQDSHVVID